MSSLEMTLSPDPGPLSSSHSWTSHYQLVLGCFQVQKTDNSVQCYRITSCKNLRYYYSPYQCYWYVNYISEVDPEAKESGDNWSTHTSRHWTIELAVQCQKAAGNTLYEVPTNKCWWRFRQRLQRRRCASRRKRNTALLWMIYSSPDVANGWNRFVWDKEDRHQRNTGGCIYLRFCVDAHTQLRTTQSLPGRYLGSQNNIRTLTLPWKLVLWEEYSE
jgi:hypothetical protein